MNRESREILHKVKENNSILTELYMGDGIAYHEDGIFNSSLGSDFNTLGQYVATNTYLEHLEVNIDDISVNATNREFYDGIKNNSYNKFVISL